MGELKSPFYFLFGRTLPYFLQEKVETAPVDPENLGRRGSSSDKQAINESDQSERRRGSDMFRNMTRMGRIMDTTLFVKNGPCMASLGLGGEGYLSFSIAGPTGEGVTTPLTFTRERRCSMIDDLWILGQPKN